MARKLPNDYAIDALAAEAARRRETMGGVRYGYGDLVAGTTPEERRQIVENWKRNRSRRAAPPGASAPYRETDDREDIEKATKQTEEAGD